MTKLKKTDFEVSNVSKSSTFKKVVFTSLIASSLAMGSCVSDPASCTDANSFDNVGSGSQCVDSD